MNRSTELTTDAGLLREKFESMTRCTYAFARSRKGNYRNPATARDWKWFQIGYKVRGEEDAKAKFERCEPGT